MNLARRHIKGDLSTRALACHAIIASAYIEITPLPDDWYEVAVKQDRAALLPNPNGTSVINPDSPSSGERPACPEKGGAMK